MYLLAPILVNILLTPEFHESITVLRILSISAIFYVLSEAYGLCNLIINHREKILRQLTLTCSIIGFAIAVPMVYYFSYIGVAITVALSRLLLGLSCMWAAKSDVNDIYSLFKLRQIGKS
jgi:PST family polysaccharide transporter